MNPKELAAQLEQLRPTLDLKVMDLVEESGIDVSGWAYKDDRTPVEKPKANPNYCYEWAFGGDAEPIALCIWHEQLAPHDGEIAFHGNLRSRAAELESIVLDRREASRTKSRAKQQAKRCDAFDRRVQLAARQTRDVRVILLVGDRADELGHDSSKVRYRLLDPVPWRVERYDFHTGGFVLVRGAKAPPVAARKVDEPESIEQPFIDQFSVAEQPERREKLVDVYVRSPDVRRRVLARAAGHCELCGRAGFVTGAGQIYLETHHVYPLATGGNDHESNVVALCPDDHRRAHFSADANTIQQTLLALLVEYRRESPAEWQPK